jgi:hypothetical protein
MVRLAALSVANRPDHTENFMASRLPRATLLLASALSLSTLGTSTALAQASDGQLASIEKQIKALQAELHRMKTEAAERDRELRAAQASRTPAPTQIAPVMPQIPAGYALVPAGPGSTPGSVVLAKAEAPKPSPTQQGTFQVGALTVKLGGFLEEASIYRSRNEVTDITTVTILT